MIRHAVIATLILACSLLAAAPAAAQTPQDVVTIGTLSTTASTVNVPVYIRDVSGTPLGVDQPSGSRIQAYSIKVDYVPTAAVQSITFTRAGITASLTPTLELTPSSPGSASFIETFPESTQPVPFTSNAPTPGNLVGYLTVTFAPTATPGTTVTLTLDATLTQLSNQAGTTKETTTLGNLQLVNGAVTLVPVVPTMSGWALGLLAAMLVVVATMYTRS